MPSCRIPLQGGIFYFSGAYLTGHASAKNTVRRSGIPHLFRPGKSGEGYRTDRQKSRHKAGFFAGHLHTQGVRQNGDNIEERGF